MSEAGTIESDPQHIAMNKWHGPHTKARAAAYRRGWPASVCELVRENCSLKSR
jgi:hypothetical protein